MKHAGTNAKATFKVLFEIGTKKYILNYITALEAEVELKPNSEVTKAIENAKEKLSTR